jgi:hypothetical protein
MDPHFAPHPEPDDRAAPMSARLPEEPLEAEEPGNADEAALAAPAADERLVRAAPPARKRRQSLLFGVAVVALVIAGAGAFLVSPYNHVVPMPGMTRTVRHLAATAGISLPAPLAPSASLASVDLPPAPNAVIRPKFRPRPPDQQLSELLSLHPGAPDAAPSSTPSRQGSGAVAALPGGANGPPPGYVPSEPGSQHVAPLPARVALPAPQPVATHAGEPQGSRDVTVTVVPSLNAETRLAGTGSEPAAPRDDSQHLSPPSRVSGASQPQATRSSPATLSVVPAPADAVKVASELRAAPLTPQLQVEVLDLVTQIATMVRDLKTEDAQLRADVSRASTDTTARLADFERRIALAEARNAVSAAGAAGAEPAAAVPSPMPTRAPPAPMTLTRATAALPVPDKGSTTRYRVQAASPGLALLAEDDRGGGDGAQIQVTVGDTLPGYGRVKSIAQHGTTWIVTTDHGNIQ